MNKAKIITILYLQRVDLFWLVITVFALLLMHCFNGMYSNYGLFASTVFIVYLIWRRTTRKYYPNKKLKSFYIEKHIPFGCYYISMIKRLKSPSDKDCYETLNSFSNIAKSNLPIGKYRAITHTRIIKKLQFKGIEVHQSEKPLFQQHLSDLRFILLHKKCPCGKVDCPANRILIRGDALPSDFFYVKFEKLQ